LNTLITGIAFHALNTLITGIAFHALITGIAFVTLWALRTDGSDREVIRIGLAVPVFTSDNEPIIAGEYPRREHYFDHGVGGRPNDFERANPAERNRRRGRSEQ
jgi:hypothetical protein